MIRSLTTDDFEKLNELGREYFAEASLPGWFSPEKFTSVLNQLMESGKLVALGLFHEGQMDGVIIGMVDDNIYSGERVGTLFCMYVRKLCRRAGGILFRRWEKMIQGQQVKHIYVGHLFPFNHQLMAGLYRRFGYEPCEIFYRKPMLIGD